MTASLNVNLTLIHGCSNIQVMLHNAILLAIQFNYLDQFTGGGGGFFMGKEEISESVSCCTHVQLIESPLIL